MKKNIIIAVLSFVALTMLLFAFFQKTEAEKQRTMTIMNVESAVEAMKQAEMNAAEAKRQEAIAQKALADLKLCQDRK